MFLGKFQLVIFHLIKIHKIGLNKFIKKKIADVNGHCSLTHILDFRRSFGTSSLQFLAYNFFRQSKRLSRPLDY